MKKGRAARHSLFWSRFLKQLFKTFSKKFGRMFQRWVFIILQIEFFNDTQHMLFFTKGFLQQGVDALSQSEI